MAAYPVSPDLAARRREFPALVRPAPLPRLAYLDAAATSLMPLVVVDAVADAARRTGNPGRGVHALAEAATLVVEDARAEVARTLGGRPDEIVLTASTTAALNLVADTYGATHVGPGDVVVATELEHHSSLLPWQRLCAARGARLVLAPVDDAGRVDADALAALLLAHPGRVKVVAVAHVGNVTGTVAPIAELAARAHAAGAVVVVDGAQAVAHLPVDVAALGCDFYAFSGHKAYGPPGTGALWARGELLAALPPWQVGGGTVGHVDADGARYLPAPARLEAGTPNTIGLAGLAAGLRFLRGLDRAAVAADEAAVHARIVDVVTAHGGRVLGRPELGVVAFALGRYHPHDVATIADHEGVALRSGHHCAAPIHARFGVDASTRASVACYSGVDDAEQLDRALARVREVLG
jgi:cysteine desulfurase / selenocysteine lyase